MNVEQLNTNMRIAYHNAGIKGSGVIFCVLDTGVKPISWLSGKVLNGTSDGQRDDDGHGTFVAGQLIEGCLDSRVISYRVIKDGKGKTEDIIAALESIYATAKKDAKTQYVVNISLSGAQGTYGDLLERYKNAIEQLVNLNVPVIVAAGNDGEQILNKYPSCFEAPITVSAIDKNANRAEFSTWHNEVDFCDYGVGVKGLNARTGLASASRDGTSMSTPNLAWKCGLIMCAYMKTYGKKMPEPLLYETLKAMATDLGVSGRDSYFGYGFVNINKTVDVKPTPEAPTPPASPEPEIPTTPSKTKFPYLAKYTGATQVNVRSGASTSFNKIGILSSWEKCIVIDEKDGWVEAVLHERAEILCGWCDKTYVKPI